MARTGRRAGDAGTRAAIIEAARAEFAGSGYTAATIRAIARRAEVDPALIYHYFADKPSLFVATQELPRDPRDIRRDTQASGSPGVRLVESFLAQWEADPREPGQSFVTLAQAVSSSPEVARSLREFLSERIWAGRQDTSADAQWRFNAISAQLVGLAWSRYLVRLEPLASASRQEVAARIGPMIERIMRGEASA
jgi:AcrR family transcriptional regulator